MATTSPPDTPHVSLTDRQPSPESHQPPLLPPPEQRQTDPGDIDETAFGTNDANTAKTPEPRPEQIQPENVQENQYSPDTPGHLTPLDWDDFESRYEQALAGANEQEREILLEFDQLVKVCDHLPMKQWYPSSHAVTVLQILGLGCCCS